jgi:hypothetical protein
MYNTNRAYMKQYFILFIIACIAVTSTAQTPINKKQSDLPSGRIIPGYSNQSKANKLPDDKQTPGPTVSSGSVTLSIKTVLDDYSVEENDYTIIAKPAGLYSKKETIKIFLPDAGSNPGKIYVIKNGSKGNAADLYHMRVDVYAPQTKQETAETANYYSLTAFKQVTMQSDGEQWWPIGN